ncbi:uncharacterized protein MELLADRAFT_70094 [Melampsora larici-populina 98AG31]|uniref:Uncharacterized protein n=1 Tax=Melampsora larici-populina (strain 98AG31 / pathotype 3-4-7) TaxID=747676 RepID=F4SDJ5_MELLP|nr:uncharacterized protein MELLADRAFT_70094 [Melampsora larici-populina 98AG31]EGF97282.1 hypothetical protein MELLADRAFT_70094 [Melampsora larici-populina 98AG31]
MTKQASQTGKTNQHRAALQNPRQPTVPDFGNIRQPKYGNHQNLGSLTSDVNHNNTTAEVGGDTSMEQTEPGDVPETPTPQARKNRIDPQLGAASEECSKADKTTEAPTQTLSLGVIHPAEIEETLDATDAPIHTSAQPADKPSTAESSTPAEKPVAEATISATQKMRQVKIKKARAEYEAVKVLYQTTLERVTGLEKEAQDGAIDKALMLTKAFLAELEVTMREDEAAYLAALSGNHPNVIFVPSNPAPPVGINRSLRPRPIPVAKKRKGPSNEDGSSKRGKVADVSTFFDLEAKVSNKEPTSEILGKGKGPKTRVKSRAFVTQEDDDWAHGEQYPNQQVEMKDVVEEKKKVEKKKEKKVEEKEEDKNETLPVDAKSIFQVEKPDLSALLIDPSPEEILELKANQDSITSSQFNWGDVLTVPAANVIHAWEYNLESAKGKPSAADLTLHLNYVRALVQDREMMYLRLQCFIKNNIKNAFSTLHDILSDSLRLISYGNEHETFKIRTDGEDGVAESSVEMGKTIAWLLNQCYSAGSDDQPGRRSRLIPSNVKSLQKKFFHIFLGMNLIYENEVHNGLIKKAELAKLRIRDIRQMKSDHKTNSVLHQLFNDRNKFSSGNLKSIAGPSKPAKTITSVSGSQSSQSANPKVVKEKLVSADTSRDISNVKKQCLLNLALFLLYGTAGLFHALPNYKEQSMPESAMIVFLASILADRRFNKFNELPHSYGDQAWNRLDNLMFTSLKRFLTNSGQFNTRIKWNEMTNHFHQEFEEKKLEALFMLDLLTETRRPGLTIGLDGLVLDHVNIDNVKLMKMNAPATESFRVLWGPTEGPPQPVTDRGRNLYPDVSGDNNQVSEKAPVDDEVSDSDNSGEDGEVVDGDEQGDGEDGSDVEEE